MRCLAHRGFPLLHTADAALMMQLGSDGGWQFGPPYHANVIDCPLFLVFVGSGIFKVRSPYIKSTIDP